MPYRAIDAYAWDLDDEGVADVVAHVRAIGLNAITIAGAAA